MNEQRNQKIHEWLGKCWHKSEAVGTVKHGGYYCRRCGTPNSLRRVPLEIEAGGHPDYTTDPAAMLELIGAVRDRDEGDTQFTIKQGKRDYWVEIHRLTEGVGEGYADTLPMAVALAVEKLIDSEGK